MSTRHRVPTSRRPRLSLIAHVVAGTLLAPLPALAQQAPATPPAPLKQEAAKPAAAAAPVPAAQAPAEAPVPVESTVTVTATKTTNRIDRQSYDVKADPATSNDTVADTLNKVPSVAVDPDGNVTLRGRSNVQILVDGKPSAMMQGENRAAAIAAIPAADLDSVEVINNPGAQFGNEGGGGPIINLVMRRERTPGGFASINANVGTEGRYNTSAFGSYTTGRMSAQGNVYRRHDGRDSTGETSRERIDPVTKAVSRSMQSSNGENSNDSAGFSGSVSYNVGEKDVAAITASFSESSNDSESLDRYRNTNSRGVVDNEYQRTSLRESRNRNYSLGARLDHKGDQPGEVFKTDLRMSGTDGDTDARYATAWTVRPSSAGAAGNRQDNDTETRIIDFTGDYELPGEHGVFKTGYKVARNRSVFDTAYFDVDAATFGERPNTSRTNRFELTDTTLALYGTYQWRVNEKWGVLGGLRGEYADLDMNQVTTRIHATNHYFDAIPSAFVTYGLSDDTTLRLSYARRIRRPGQNELNPFVVYRDELNVSSGNPNLQPSNTDSLELGMETKLGKVDTTVRLYARRDTDLISERRFFIANDVLLTTRENAGSSQSGGIEFNFSGRATPKLTVNVNGNIGYTEQTVLGSVNDGKRSATSISGRARLAYQIDPTNRFQLMLNAQGKTLFGEGYRQPVRTADFNYSRNLTPALTLLVNINDLFDSQKMESITETDILREYSLRRFGGRVAFVGLSYRFGSFGGPGGQRRPMMFGGPGGPGGPGGGGGRGPGG
ncbi:outer membrane beta-barrel family protein [Massilia yuzhufengensis]|uniref:Outer membrane receptor proteins, mostly Fe transport n=1 Tax=Massilia yuzhufengensis TaxID=1164594 RepID=A0A1I1L108_9BURK|nr:outer membrane beta-barrel family protein [Massilia yuzhufengensis]SFC66202.1 Outer membrane receptor proteins, mostly Fe transport [Massilia yuzhufengensis]